MTLQPPPKLLLSTPAHVRKFASEQSEVGRAVAPPPKGTVKLRLALLHEVEQAGGVATHSAIVFHMRRHFTAITDEDLAVLNDRDRSRAWEFRVHSARMDLVLSGMLERITSSLYRITPSGTRWLNRHWRGPDADYTQVPAPQIGSQPGEQSVRLSQRTEAGPEQTAPGVGTEPTVVQAMTGANDTLHILPGMHDGRISEKLGSVADLRKPEPAPSTSLPSSGDARLWLLFLHEVDALHGETRVSILRDRLHAYFPEAIAGLADPGRREPWVNCVNWARQHLVRRGCLEPSSIGYVRLTEAGQRWLRANWRGPNQDYADVARPEELATDQPRPPTSRRAATAPNVDRTLHESRLQRRLIEQALNNPASMDAVDRYLLGVVALELGQVAHAASLLKSAMDAGLEPRFAERAEQLQMRCVAQLEQ
jgi:DNA-binding PadR family transcriptional regulator